MMVPSRSKKTVFPSAIFEILSQFFRRNRCRSQFAHDNGTGVIGNFSRFQRCGAAAKREREQSDSGITRARNVEDLSSLCRHMMRLLTVLEKHHSLFAQSDEDQLRLPFLQQTRTDLAQNIIVRVLLLERNLGGVHAATSIWFD